jgi:hypothetical protein
VHGEVIALADNKIVVAVITAGRHEDRSEGNAQGSSVTTVR